VGVASSVFDFSIGVVLALLLGVALALHALGTFEVIFSIGIV